jgi:peptidoglycan/xylan/chitin deacetylase (PgdA/CDA1 family)
LRRSLAGIVTAAGVGYLCPSITAGVPALRPLFGIRDRIEDGDGVALTFDDGPHADGTPAVLELLESAAVHATFFLVGEQVERRPQLAARIADAGHQIGLHCQEHRSLLRTGPRQTRDDLRRAVAAIEAATGQQVRLYRPPYGVLNATALVTARRNGWEIWLWRREGRDWQARATADSIARRLMRRTRPGDVLLLHDADHYSAPGSWRRTAAALPLVLDQLGRSRLRTRLLPEAPRRGEA